jgi:DNA/RNA-binding domain of Phe-tRNA-synthetase-like protein
VTDELELAAAEGFIEPELRAEFPGLRLVWLTVAARLTRSSRAVERRLGALSNRYRGASVIAMRTQPVPHAYRSFYHQVGMDPDSSRTPSERAAVARLLQGGFRSQNLLADALLIAVVETGVPVWALDADFVDVGGLGIRSTVEGDRLGSSEYAHHLAPGRLVIADARHVHAVLFEEVAAAHQVSPKTSRIALFALGVEGVPAIHLEEALWMCVEILHEADRRSD